MRKTFLILLLFFVPLAVSGFTADDFAVNTQSIYAVPPGSTNVLIMDLSLSEPISSIKIQNEGTAQQHDISKILIYKDGSSAGWDNDEKVIFTRSSSPFWDVEFSLPEFSEKRIFVTVDIGSGTVSGRTIKPKAIISKVEITGFEREISSVASPPAVPAAPWAISGESLSSSAIRWHFTDNSDNELGFKILDGNLKEVARMETADISYIDETGLEPDTEYSGRRVVAFNDRGENTVSSLAIFSAARTLKAEEVEAEITEEETAEEEVTEEIGAEKETVDEEVVEEETAEELSLLETIQQKITALQQQLDELFDKLAELLEQQGATIWQAFQRFFQSFFGK